MAITLLCRAHLPDKCTECGQVVETQPSIQPRIAVAYVEPSWTVYVGQNMEVEERLVLRVQPRQQGQALALTPHRVDLPTDGFFPHPDRPGDEN